MLRLPSTGVRRGKLVSLKSVKEPSGAPAARVT
jgi:hypothetical protein